MFLVPKWNCCCWQVVTTNFTFCPFGFKDPFLLWGFSSFFLVLLLLPFFFTPDLSLFNFYWKPNGHVYFFIFSFLLFFVLFLWSCWIFPRFCRIFFPCFYRHYFLLYIFHLKNEFLQISDYVVVMSSTLSFKTYLDVLEEQGTTELRTFLTNV